MSYAGSATLKNVAKPRSSLLVHAYGHEVTGLKTYRGPKRKEQLGVCSLPGFYAPKADLTAPKSDFRFTPESGLKTDIASGPFRAISGSHWIPVATGEQNRKSVG